MARPTGSTTSEIRILTKIRTELKNTTVSELIENMLSLALNETGKVPATVQRGAIKDLLDMGVNVEKEILKYKNKDSSEEDDEDDIDGEAIFKLGS